jgi:hypothetical protein
MATIGRLTITIESNSLSGGEWLDEIAALLRLAESCPQIDIRRTAGTLRESSRPPGDPVAAERRRLALTVEPLAEAFTLGLSEWGAPDSHLAEDHEPAQMEAISLALWGRLPPDLGHSDLEDVAHLHTHLRHRRDIFVSKDEQMHKRHEALAGLGVHVYRPAEAFAAAAKICGAGDTRLVTS